MYLFSFRLMFAQVTSNSEAISDSRVRLVRGTGRDGTERGVPSRVWCAKNGWNGLFHGTDFGCFCVPPLPPGTGLFHVCGTQCFTILRQIYPMSFSKITPLFRPVPSRSVPSRPRTKRTLRDQSGSRTILTTV
ncbi:unnamed protein product [Malus baccata var. baccata]